MCECILTINHACMYHAMPAGMHTHLVGIEMMETSIAKWQTEDVLKIYESLIHKPLPAFTPWASQQTKSHTFWYLRFKNLPARSSKNSEQGFSTHAKKLSRKWDQLLVPRTAFRSKWPDTGFSSRTGSTSKNRVDQQTPGCDLNRQKSLETCIETSHRCKQIFSW